jgi:hypothetical protein
MEIQIEELKIKIVTDFMVEHITYGEFNYFKLALLKDTKTVRLYKVASQSRNSYYDDELINAELKIDMLTDFDLNDLDCFDCYEYIENHIESSIDFFREEFIHYDEETSRKRW